ncbi:MAG: ribosome silencing factor [Deltaproteobacteria bacterium]|nr:ribosome silencing factor [Deltaproteobacteria bacterium]
MPAKKKRAATAPSKKPAAKKAKKKAATKKAATKAAPKKAKRRVAAAKVPTKARAGKAVATAPTVAVAPAPLAPRRPEAPPDPTEQLAQALAALTLSKKAEDVVILHVTDMTSYADFFVLASAPSERQVQAIARHVAEELKKCGRAPLGTEGLEQGHWVLVDYGAVVLHVFLGNARHYYDLEGFWSDAPRVDVDEARGLRVLTALEAAANEAAARAADADESPAFAANE